MVIIIVCTVLKKLKVKAYNNSRQGNNKYTNKGISLI